MGFFSYNIDSLIKGGPEIRKIGQLIALIKRRECCIALLVFRSLFKLKAELSGATLIGFVATFLPLLDSIIIGTPYKNFMLYGGH